MSSCPVAGRKRESRVAFAEDGKGWAPVAASAVVPVTSARTRAYLAQHRLLDQCASLRNDAPWRATRFLDRAMGHAAKEATVVSAWVAPAGATTPLHFDRHRNLLCHCVGTKDVLLWPPSTRVPANAPPNENTSSRVDCAVAPPPGAAAARLEAGDVLFVPRGWWHYVATRRTSLSLSLWFP